MCLFFTRRHDNLNGKGSSYVHGPRPIPIPIHLPVDVHDTKVNPKKASTTLTTIPSALSAATSIGASIATAPTTPTIAGSPLPGSTQSSATNVSAPVTLGPVLKVPAVPRRPESICHLDMSRRDMYAALAVIYKTLSDVPYAIIGGVACIVLGSPRPTKDLDIVVPDGRAAEAAALLAATGAFGTEVSHTGRRRTWYHASQHRNYNLDILEPHDINQSFTSTGGVPKTILANGYPVLHPAQLLNFKIASWMDRMHTHGYKKINHAKDIRFLTNWLARENITVTKEEVTHATDDFLVLFSASYPGMEKAFDKIGLSRVGRSKRNSIDSRWKDDDWWYS